MPRINNGQRSFSSQCFENRVRPNAVALRINQIIDWKPIENILDRAYAVGLGNMGRKAYPPIVLFKMSLLQIWYGLSDAQIEEQTWDRCSFMAFCGLTTIGSVPDPSLLSRFRAELANKNTFEQLLQ